MLFPRGEYQAQYPFSSNVGPVKVNVGNVKNLDAVPAIIAVILFVVWVGAQLFIDHTLSNLFTTLAIVETPSVALPDDEPPKYTPLATSADEVTLGELPAEDVPPKSIPKWQRVLGAIPGTTSATRPSIMGSKKPLTSSIRATLRHLTEQGGRGAIFTGLGTRIIKRWAEVAVAIFLANFLPAILASVMAYMIVSPLDTVLKHTMMTRRSSRWFFRRLPTAQTSKKLLLPFLIAGTAQFVTGYITLSTVQLAHHFDFEENKDASSGAIALGLLRSSSPFLVKLVLFILIQIPAEVTLIRSQASVLPEEETTVVACDRTFGGLVVAESEGGSGVIGVVDAWRSFDWSCRRRLLLAYAKIWGIELGIMMVTLPAVIFVVIASL